MLLLQHNLTCDAPAWCTKNAQQQRSKCAQRKPRDRHIEIWLIAGELQTLLTKSFGGDGILRQHHLIKQA